MSVQARATELREECIRALCGAPVKNSKLLDEIFGDGAILTDGDGAASKLVTAALTYVLDTPATGKRRGRPPKVKADDNAGTDGDDKPPTKRRGRPPKVKATPASPPDDATLPTDAK